VNLDAAFDVFTENIVGHVSFSVPERLADSVELITCALFVRAEFLILRCR